MSVVIAKLVPAGLFLSVTPAYALLAAGLFAAFMGLLTIHRLRPFFGLTPLTEIDYLVIASIVVVWALVLRLTWRTHLLDRLLGVDLQPRAQKWKAKSEVPQCKSKM